MTTLWSWSSSTDTDFDSATGTAHTVETAGSYGQRMKWAAQASVVAYGAKNLTALGNFGCRFIYTVSARPTTSFSLLVGQATGGVTQFRADMTATGTIRIRDGSATVVTGAGVHALDTEYRMEVFRSGTTLTFKSYRVSDNALIDSITGTVGGTALAFMFFGNQAPITGTLGPYTYDEMVLTDVAAEIGAVGGGGGGSSTLWSWSSSTDLDFETNTGTPHTVELAGTFGQRMKWAAQTNVAAYGAKSIPGSPTDIGIRFIYTHAARPTTSFGVLGGMSSGTAVEFRADLTLDGKLRIRNSSATVVSGTVALLVGVEYRFEIYRVGTTLTFKAYRIANNTLVDSISGTVGGAPLVYLFVGNQAPITGTLGPYTYDEIIVKNVGAEIGPLTGYDHPPIANAGVDLVDIEPYSTVTLDGTATDVDTSLSSIDLVWTQVSDGAPAVVLSGGGVDPCTFVAPGTVDGTTLTFALKATEQGHPELTDTDPVSITVLPVTERAAIGGVEVAAKLIGIG